MKKPSLIAIAALLVAAAGRAEVTRVEIASRTDVASTNYEKIVGTVYFAVDAKDTHNRLVVDLDKAPVNAGGRVEFSADMLVLRPKGAAQSNGAALVEVLNRGNKLALTGFGEPFLLGQGFTVAWVGWEFDVPDQPGLMKIHVPVATDHRTPITGIVRAPFTINTAAKEFVATDVMMYDAIDPAGPDSQLTVRSTFLGRADPIARDTWRVSGHTVTLDTGFEPGKTYEISYRAANPPIAGLGFVALRDFGSWLKHGGQFSFVRHTIAFGASQSGRFLRDFMYEGFNTDERDRQVFDGVMAHIAGASRIGLNERWATPRGLGVHSATAFPFADAATVDPISGAREGLLDNPRVRHAPKVFYTNTAVEYWGTGRVAALVHTDPSGTSDLTLPDNVRVYFLAGTQHTPARFPPEIGNGQQRDNPVDYWPTLRALVVAMHQWIRDGVAPPPSAYPTLRDRTLVKASDVEFPAIRGVASPRTLTAGARVANALIAGGAGAGAQLPLLVPDVDDDGNDRAGIRLPDVAVPLATYTGWNFRNASIGGTGELVPLLGSSIPFPATRSERSERKDPRRSIAERYPSREEYLTRVREAADALVSKRYLIAGDVANIVRRASDQWDNIVGARLVSVGRR